jgi:spermidine synthase
MNLEIVEIDEEVVNASKKYLGLIQTSNMKIMVKDARQHFVDCAGGYDIIFLDAFTDTGIPEDLISKEFLQVKNIIIFS